MKKIAKKISIILAIALPFLCAARLVYAASPSWAEKTAMEILAYVGNAIMGLCAWILYLSALLFDYAVKISIINLTKFETIDSMWTIARNLANLFFIFIALYIGITTILRIGGHDTKQLLTKLIIVALLVNFSLFISKTVINASNVLAMEFYNAMKPQGSVTVAGGEITGLSAIFAEGLSPQTLYNIEKTNFGKLGTRDATAGQILIVSVFGSILILIAAFVLFAGAVMFVMRNVYLWLLMIFSPLAFVAMILPKTAGYAQNWTSKLLNQSFFAPAFLFLFYLVAKMINEKVLLKFFDAQEASYAGLLLNGETASPHIGLVMVYIVLILLMLATLKVSSAMGATGAAMVTKWGADLKNRIQGYAGKLPGRMATRIAAKPTEAFATGKAEEGAGRITRASAWLGKVSRKVPIAGRMATRGAAKIMEANVTNIERIKEDLKTVNPGELEKIAQRSTSTGFTRIAALQRLTELQKLENMPEQTVATLRNLMQRYGAPIMNLDKLKWQYSSPDKIVPTLTANQFREIVEKGGKTSDKYLSYISNLAGAAGSLEDVAETLKEMKNHSLASYMLSSAGAPIFQAYRGEAPPKKPKEEKPKEEKSLLVDQYGRPLS